MASQSQVKDKANQAKQENKAFEKAKKDKKQKSHLAKQNCDQQESNISALKTNTTPIKKKTGQNQGQNQGQNRNQNRDVSKVTCYNCNKKGYYANNYIKSKN